MRLPSGTVTFLFTDIEGSTRLWEQYPEAMRVALARHDALLREAIESNDGVVFKTVGDAFCAAFPTAPKALVAALAAQRALMAEPWETGVSLRVRMALHVGVAEERNGDYFGPPLNRVARLLAIGHGGQVLLSLPVEELVRENLPPEAGLKDLGVHRLHDLASPEQVYQVLSPNLPADFPPLKSLDRLPTNLPVQLTSFIGREKEMEAVKSLLTTTRLLTLTGAGGFGKTRLALQVAADLLDAYPDGIWLVELAALSNPTLVPQTMASVLSLREEPDRTLLQTLIEYLKEKQLLLVLDNCEHLIDACARLVHTLLRSCPPAAILATSREPLGIAGERTYRVPSLSPPDPSTLPTEEKDLPAIIAEYDAVRLFVERASLQQPAFTLNRQNATAVAQVCYRLDGIPLALELAAARTRALPVKEMNARLDDRFRLLTGGSRTALPRQQTLRALIDWSYDLLNAQEKVLLHRFSVFASGATLEAAEQVIGDREHEQGTGSREQGIGGRQEGAARESGSNEAQETVFPVTSNLSPITSDEVLDLLAALVDKSLVAYEDTGAGGRYRLLETIRQYAREKLEQSGEAAAILSRHGGYFLKLAEAAAAQLRGAEAAAWLDRLESEHGNLRAALDRSREAPDGAEAELRMAAALWLFWSMRGYLTEGRERLTAALARPEAQEATRSRAEALSGAGGLAYYQGDYASARAAFRENLSLRRSLGDQVGLANCLQNLALLDTDQSDHAAARPLYAEAVAIYRALGNRGGEGICLNNMAIIDLDEGNYAAALPLLEASLVLLEEVGNRPVHARVLNNLGAAFQGLGDLPQARARYQASLALNRELGNKSSMALSLASLTSLALQMDDLAAARLYSTEALVLCREIGEKRVMAFVLERIAGLAAKRSQWRRAARLYGAAQALRAAIGVPIVATDREDYDESVTSLRNALDEQAFTSAWAEGEAMELDQAIAYALEE